MCFITTAMIRLECESGSYLVIEMFVVISSEGGLFDWKVCDNMLYSSD